MQYISTLIYALFIFMLLSCDPLVTEFSNDEIPKKYTSKTLTTPLLELITTRMFLILHSCFITSIRQLYLSVHTIIAGASAATL